MAQPDLDSLTGDAGVQIRLPFAFKGEAISPYINLTVEHDFISADRTLLSIETQAPLLPIYSNVPGLSGGTYGKVAAGVSTSVGGGLSALINVSSTFAREGGNDFGVSGGLQLAFVTQ